MYYGTGSYPPGCHGWHFKSRLTASHPPLKTPCFMIASRAYWLQVGRKRHTPRGPSKGRINNINALSKNSAVFLNKCENLCISPSIIYKLSEECNIPAFPQSANKARWAECTSAKISLERGLTIKSVPGFSFSLLSLKLSLKSLLTRLRTTAPPNLRLTTIPRRVRAPG